VEFKEAVSFGFTLGLAFSNALAPFGIYSSITKLIFGSIEDAPEGCAAGLLLLLPAPFIGWWSFNHLVVVWQ
jgi:hypothetical protein